MVLDWINASNQQDLFHWKEGEK